MGGEGEAIVSPRAAGSIGAHPPAKSESTYEERRTAGRDTGREEDPAEDRRSLQVREKERRA